MLKEIFFQARPIHIPESNRDFSLAAVGDVDGNDTLEVGFFSGQSEGSRPHLLQFDATYLPGWPFQLAWEHAGPTTIGDLDRDGRSELITTTEYLPEDGIAVYRETGAQFIFIPRLPAASSGVAYHRQEVALGDLDRDGDLEMVVPFFPSLAGFPEYPGTVDAWHHNGNAVPGWPVTFPGEITDIDTGVSVVIGNIDADPDPEVLLASHNSESSGTGERPEDRGFVFINAWNHDGTPLPWSPLRLPRNEVGWEGSVLVLTDLDNDGFTDLVNVRGEGRFFGARPPRTWVSVYKLPGAYDRNSPWPMFHHDVERTGAKT